MTLALSLLTALPVFSTQDCASVSYRRGCFSSRSVHHGLSQTPFFHPGIYDVTLPSSDVS
jgi:hypothetical protein